MDPITRKLITARGDVITETSDVFAPYCWNGHDTSAGIHTANVGIDMVKYGGMFWGKKRDSGGSDYNWYTADTVRSPLDGTQGDPNSGEAVWSGHPTSTGGSEQNWTVPAGVTSICILCVGGGAGADGGNSGGGGGLTWINDVPVTPGTTLKVWQGRSGSRFGSTGGDKDGEDSYVKDASGNMIIQAQKGLKDQNNSGGSGGNDVNNIGLAYQNLTYGGGAGGMGDGYPSGTGGKGGGGGAGGYSGKGGAGGSSCNNGENGAGGGGGGGGGHCSTDGGQGGGVGLFVEGTSGFGGGAGNYAGPGSGGSGGYTGASSYGSWNEYTGAFGGGCGAGSGGGGRGAVRILWGAGRAFPSTNVGQTRTYTHADYLCSDDQNVERQNQTTGLKKWTETGMEWDGTPGPENIGQTDDQNFGYFFRQSEKFFTIVEYTGNGSTQTLPHDLKCKPSMMWIKNRDTGREWAVYHDHLDSTNPELYRMWLNDTRDRQGGAAYWDSTQPTDSHFTVGSAPQTNESGNKFIAYLFGADQAAFGQRGDEVIAKTGTYTGSQSVIDLGWEPQMVILKSISGSGNPQDYNWVAYDKVRRMGLTNQGGAYGEDAEIYPNMNSAENMGTARVDFISNGFEFNDNGNVSNRGGTNYIYYAIRNNLTTPKSATEVFAMSTGNGGSQLPTYTSNFPVDFAYRKNTQSGNDWNVTFRKIPRRDMKWNDRMTNMGNYSEFEFGSSYGWNKSSDGANYQSWMFKRAKGFFDLQFWEGNRTTPRQLPHQLGVAPEMIIVKSRDTYQDGWYVYHKDIPSQSYLMVHEDYGYGSGANVWTANAPTDTHFYVGDDNSVNGGPNGPTYTGQLYATLPGISKVGSYEVNANGDSVSVDCGFTAGPRFLLIKRYELNGAGGGSGADWMLFDTVRGMQDTHAQFGNAEFTTPGYQSWMCPAGVTSISILCIGAGGGGRSGGGGGLSYRNNVTVVPGTTYFLQVGQNSNTSTGGESYFEISNLNRVCTAAGGKSQGAGSEGGPGGTTAASYNDGGGNGGNGAIYVHGDNGGGGGAGGYSGNGGNAGYYGVQEGTAGSGGGGGGGGGWSDGYTQGTGGGGVGLYGEGANGTAGNAGNPGGGGSGGADGRGSGHTNRYGGDYGGGAGTYATGSYQNSWGGKGAVRIVWSVDGSPVAFPSTNVQSYPSGHDAVLKLNKQDASVSDTNYLNKTNSGFTANANTALTTPNSKYIFLAIA